MILIVHSPALVHHVLVLPRVIVGNVKASMNFSPKGNFDSSFFARIDKQCIRVKSIEGGQSILERRCAFSCAITSSSPYDMVEKEAISIGKFMLKSSLALAKKQQ